MLIYDVYFCSVSTFYREKKVAQRDWVPFLWSHGWSESELRLELRFFLAWQLQICPWILMVTLLLLLLSRFSRVRLCATPKTTAHQAPPSLGFSRQEHWSGLPFPSPMHESEKWKRSCSVVSDPQRPHGLQPTRLLHPWDFPGKSTRVGCHCLLQKARLF